MSATLVYSTSTNTPAVDHREPEQVVRAYDDPWDVAFCFVCSRATDHFAEHDDLVEAGLAFYEGGNVWPVDHPYSPRAGS